MNKKAELIALLGKNDPVEVTGEILQVKGEGDFVYEDLLLTLNTIEKVPGIFAYPKGVKNAPLVLFNHSHGGNFKQGKKELFNSSEYLQSPSFGETLLEMGYGVACIDHFSFGERQGKKESELVKEFLLTGRTLWGMRLFDSVHFLDYLVKRPEVDEKRIATIGMSMGGMMSWWLGCLDSRIKVVGDIAGQGDLETLIEERGLDHHGFYYYVPQLLTHFSTSELQELILPKYRVSVTGKDDLLCPINGVKKLQKHLTKAYKQQEIEDHFLSVIATGGHQETKEMRKIWQEFFQKNL